MLLDKRVHSPRVRLHQLAGFGVQLRHVARRRPAESQRPKILVNGERCGTKDFGQLAARHSP